jgi:hypothetical protein
MIRAIGSPQQQAFSSPGQAFTVFIVTERWQRSLHFFHSRLLPFCISKWPFVVRVCKHDFVSWRPFLGENASSEASPFYKFGASAWLRLGNRGNSLVLARPGSRGRLDPTSISFSRFRQIFSSNRPGKFLRTREDSVCSNGMVLAHRTAIEPGLSFSTGLPVAVWGQLIGGRRGDAWSGRNGFL